MERTELIKGILKLGKELDSNHGMGSVMIVDDMERLVEKYEKQLLIQRVSKRSELLTCKHCGFLESKHSKETKLCPDRMKHFKAS